MKIGCWNVNSLRARLPKVEAWIRKERWDAILLQETKVVDALFPEAFFQDLGYYVCYAGEKSYNGVAIASRWPLEEVQTQDYTGQGQARYLEAVTRGVRIICLYVPNGKALGDAALEDKMKFFKGVRDHVRPYVSEFRSTLMGGDWNVALSNEDVYDALGYKDRLLVSEPERVALHSLLMEGWRDSLCAQEGQKNPYTWWPYQGRAWQKGEGLRLDYFFLSPWAMDRWKGAGVDSQWRGKEGCSDHAPIWLELADGCEDWPLEQQSCDLMVKMANFIKG